METTDDRLRLYIEALERLAEERKAISEDIRDKLNEAASAGYDKKAIREVLKIRAMPAEKRHELEAVLTAYLCALGVE